MRAFRYDEQGAISRLEICVSRDKDLRSIFRLREEEEREGEDIVKLL
jgi:hypothetical protein